MHRIRLRTRQNGKKGKEMKIIMVMRINRARRMCESSEKENEGQKMNQQGNLSLF